MSKTPQALDERNQLDFDSKCGRFGWETIDGHYIPITYRLNVKYCALRIAGIKLLNNYLHKLHLNVYNKMHVEAYYLTNTEVALYNEINTIHCDKKYGGPFTINELIVSFDDVKQFYEYLKVCHYKLATKSTSLRDRCGFIRINNELIIPFINQDGVILLPEDCFKNKRYFVTYDVIRDWDLRFLRFCFIVQDDKRFMNDFTLEMMTLDWVKHLYPPGSSFEPFWPELDNSSFLFDNTIPPNALHKIWTCNFQAHHFIYKNPITNLSEYGLPLEQVDEPHARITYTRSSKPHKIEMMRIENKCAPCINMRPYDSTQYLITLLDFEIIFLGKSHYGNSKPFLDDFPIKLYRGNQVQMQILYDAKKCDKTDEYLPLMNVQDIPKILPQLKYLLEHYMRQNNY